MELDGIRNAIDEMEDIYNHLLCEEDYDEREGLVRMGIDRAYYLRTELNKLERKTND